MSTGETHSVNDIRTAIRELSARADLARKEGTARRRQRDRTAHQRGTAKNSPNVRSPLGLTAEPTKRAAVEHDRRHVRRAR